MKKISEILGEEDALNYLYGQIKELLGKTSDLLTLRRKILTPEMIESLSVCPKCKQKHLAKDEDGDGFKCLCGYHFTMKQVLKILKDE